MAVVLLRRKRRPHFVDTALSGFLLFLLLMCMPRPDAEETEHVHAVDLVHAPAAFKQLIVGGIDEIRQRQVRGVSLICVVSVCAAVVGNSLRM